MPHRREHIHVWERDGSSWVCKRCGFRKDDPDDNQW